MKCASFCVSLHCALLLCHDVGHYVNIGTAITPVFYKVKYLVDSIPRQSSVQSVFSWREWSIVLVIGVIQQVGQQWLGKQTFITAVLPMDRAVGVCRALSLMSLSLSFARSLFLLTHTCTQGDGDKFQTKNKNLGYLKLLCYIRGLETMGRCRAPEGWKTLCK